MIVGGIVLPTIPFIGEIVMKLNHAEKIVQRPEYVEANAVIAEAKEEAKVKKAKVETGIKNDKKK